MQHKVLPQMQQRSMQEREQQLPCDRLTAKEQGEVTALRINANCIVFPDTVWRKRNSSFS